jgi:ATP dependent DNA ligase domain
MNSSGTAIASLSAGPKESSGCGPAMAGTGKRNSRRSWRPCGRSRSRTSPSTARQSVFWKMAARTFMPFGSKHTCRDAVLVAFDLLGMDGADLRRLPLHERRRRLAAVLAGGGPDALLFSSHVEAGEGEALFRHACAMNLEGIVSKRLEAPYRSGLSQAWRKIKCPGYSRP